MKSVQIKLESISKVYLFSMLFMPFTSYIYTVWLGLPKTITHFYVFAAIGLGLMYLVLKRTYYVPLFVKFLFLFTIYKNIWFFIINEDMHALTKAYYYVLDFATIFLAVIIYNTEIQKKYIRYSTTVIKFVILLSMVASIIQVFNLLFYNATLYFEQEIESYMLGSDVLYTMRRQSLFGFIDANAYGLAFLPLLAICLSVMNLNKNKLWFVIIIAGGLVAFLSNSRYVMVGFVLLSFLIPLQNRSDSIKNSNYVVFVILLMISIVTVLNYIGYNIIEWYYARLFAEGDITQSSRYYAVLNFIEFFPQAPFFGTGTLTEEVKRASEAIGSSHIHVGYLSHLVYYGLFGCFFLYGGWFLLLVKYFNTAIRTNYWGSFFGFLVFLWSFATMSQSMLFYVGIIFTMVFDKYYQDGNIDADYEVFEGTDEIVGVDESV